MYKRLAIPIIGALLAVICLIGMARVNSAAAFTGAQKELASLTGNLGTSFSYQGQLLDSGVPVDGAFDFLFSLYDSGVADSGTQLGQVDLTNILVQDGLFTVGLDFGAVFDGTALWLEIWVRASGTGDAFTELEPRQAITPVPFAHYASSAPWSGLSAIPPGFSDGVDDDALGLLNCSAGQITEWNGSSWVCGSDDTGGGDSAWLLSGNSGTTPGVNFLGTIDSTPMELRVANQRAWRLEPGVNSPNIIAGYSFNAAGSGVSGATISGGGYDLAINQVTADYGVVGGGRGNTASGYAAVVDGGEGNIASSSYATVGGGSANTTTGDYASLLGGQNNLVYGAYGMIGGGSGNSVTGTFATVPGGAVNSASGNYTSIGGGYYNQVEAAYGTIAGGGPSDIGNPTTSNNRVFDDYGVIGGGGGNVAGSDDADPTSAQFASVGGGSGNTAGGSYSTVSGGSGNSATGYGASVNGGEVNSAVSNYAAVGGGSSNATSGQYSVIASGSSNSTSAQSASIAGGQSNVASATFGAIGGGYGNNVAAVGGTIPGGYGNSAGGEYGFAAGFQASAAHQGTFVWSDSNDGFASTGPDQFLIDASGGVGIGTNAPSEQLTVVGNAAINGGLSIDGSVQIQGGTAITVGLVLPSARRHLESPSAIYASGDTIYVTASSTNTLEIYNVSDPDNPELIGYTRSDLSGPVDVQVMGDLAYIASELNNQLVIMDISNPANPESVGSADKNLDHPNAVYVSGNYAYVASGGNSGGPDGLVIFNVADPKEILSIGFTNANLDGTSDV